MRKRWLSIALLCVLAAASADGQEDIHPAPVARKGDYAFRALLPEDPDVALLCCDRMDPSRQRLFCDAAGPAEVVNVLVTVQITPKDDAEVRCFAYDGADPELSQESEPSPNAAILDFTPPGQVKIQP